MFSNSLDSRSLGHADTYIHKFTQAGDYRYKIVAGTHAAGHPAFPFLVSVRKEPNPSGPQQFDVQIKKTGDGYDVSARQLTVNAGDVVTWNPAETEMAPVALLSDHRGFSSAHLANPSVYCHAFGTAGEFHWIDAYGRKLRGTVTVKDPGVKTDADRKKWEALLANGTVVTISDNKVVPASVTIFTGQTVFFAVTASSPVSITDKQLL